MACHSLRRSHRTDSRWAWLVCASALISEGLHMGYVNCFAIMLPALMNEYNETRQNVAWIGSVDVALTFGASPISATLAVKFGCRAIAILGILTCAVSLVISSFANTILVLYFINGLCYGVGTNLVHCANMLIVTKYFVRRRALATGLVGAGPSIFMQGIGPLAAFLNNTVGWRNTYRILASIATSVLVLVAISFNPNVVDECELEGTREPVSSGSARGDSRTSSSKNINSGSKACTSIDDSHHNRADNCLREACDREGEGRRWKIKFDCSFWRVPQYFVVVVCITLEGLGVYAPFIHLIKHCKEQGLSSQLASTLFTYIGVSSLVGRVVSGQLCDALHLSPLILHQFSDVVISASMLLIWLAKDYAAFSGFAVLYGIGNGVYTTTLFLMLLNTVEPQYRPLAFGLGEFFHSIGCVFGPSLAGMIADKADSYIPAFYMTGGVVLLASFIPFTLLCCKKTTSSWLEIVDINQERVSLPEKDKLLIYERETVL